MKTVIQDTLGIKVKLDVPSTNEEVDQLMNQKDGAAAAAVDKYIFHSWLGNFRKKLCVILAEKSGLAQAEGETDKTFVDRIRASDTGIDIQAEAQALADNLPVNMGGASSGRVAKRYLDRASAIITAITAGESSFDRVVTNLEGRNIGLSIPREKDGSVTEESLAYALKADEERLKSMNSIL